MTASQLAYYVRQQSRMRGLQAAMIAALVDAFENIRQSVGENVMATLIKSGDLTQLLFVALSSAVLDRSFAPVTAELHSIMERAFWQTVPDLPKGGKINGVMAVSFGPLNPDVIAAIRALDTKVLQSLKDDVRDTVRAFIENGLRNGDSAATIARELRGYIGLGPSQLQEVQNYRDALQGLNGRSIKDYALRNRTVDRLIKKNGALTPAQVDRYTTAYTKARVAQNAATVARTAMADAYKIGQRLSWSDAEASGVIPPGYSPFQQWIGVADERERDSHLEMNNSIAPLDGAFSNGDTYPGEQDFWNCRCIARIFLVKDG